MNAREYEALSDEYLTHEARSLYVLCLRQHMDFSTGLVGTARRRVSYQQFKEHLSVSRPRRSTKPAFIPSLQQLRGFVEELVRVGLVERLPIRHRQDPMVFRLPLATADINPVLFRPNEEQHLSNKEQQQEGQQQEQQSEPVLNQGINPQEQQEEQQQEQHLSNKEEQHTSVTSVNKSHTNAHEGFADPITTVDEFDARFAEPVSDDACPPATENRGRKFAMFAQWQPDHTFTDQAFTLGLDLRSLDMDQGERIEQALEEFKTWWIESRPGAANTQRLWQQKFIQTSLKREFEKHNNNSQRTGADHGNGHSENSGKYQQSPVTKAYTAEDFDLDASF